MAADPFESFLKEISENDDEIGKIVAMTPLSPAPDLSPKGGSSSIHRNKHVAPAVPDGWKAKWSTRRERWYYASPAGQSQWDLPTAAEVELGSCEHGVQQCISLLCTLWRAEHYTRTLSSHSQQPQILSLERSEPTIPTCCVCVDSTLEMLQQIQAEFVGSPTSMAKVWL